MILSKTSATWLSKATQVVMTGLFAMTIGVILVLAALVIGNVGHDALGIAASAVFVLFWLIFVLFTIAEAAQLALYRWDKTATVGMYVTTLCMALIFLLIAVLGPYVLLFEHHAALGLLVGVLLLALPVGILGDDGRKLNGGRR